MENRRRRHREGRQHAGGAASCGRRSQLPSVIQSPPRASQRDCACSTVYVADAVLLLSASSVTT
jgi:hypothetical protein